MALFQNNYSVLTERLEQLLDVKRTLGLLPVLVFFFEREEQEGANPLWTFPVPQPQVVRAEDRERLEEGGISKGGEFWLRGFPKSNNDKDRLDTSGGLNVEKYWVIGSNNSQCLAYTTIAIEEKMATYDVKILRFAGINEGQLFPFEFSGPTLRDIDRRVAEKVAIGALR